MQIALATSLYEMRLGSKRYYANQKDLCLLPLLQPTHRPYDCQYVCEMIGCNSLKDVNSHPSSRPSEKSEPIGKRTILERQYLS